MNKKSAYVNSELFQKCLKEQFVPIKLQELAQENDIILFCLLSHTTQALQPLDRSFFKPFKTYFASETKNWMLTDAIIIPLEGNVSPSILSQNHNVETVEVITPGEYYLKECSPVPKIQNLDEGNLAQDQPVAKELDANADPGPSSSTINREPESVEVITPSKYLNECSPIPKIPVPLYKRGKQGAAVLNSEEHIHSKEAKLKGKAKKQTPDKPRKNNQKLVPKKKRPRFSSESEQDHFLKSLVERFELILNGLVEQEVHVEVHVLRLVLEGHGQALAALLERVHLELVEHDRVHSET
ncbi:unnamed protein product [Leptidea sinapis]|uniref:DDE-1 domain-containing protein n=1 Tax=Leptidea sinapis TaxID=189913 RepID=A0A5E4QHG7_9NEOP|nr:unnamed protein product [Leptidea sinapis]